MTEDEPADNCDANAWEENRMNEPQECHSRIASELSTSGGCGLLNKSCFKLFGANGHCETLPDNRSPYLMEPHPKTCYGLLNQASLFVQNFWVIEWTVFGSPCAFETVSVKGQVIPLFHQQISTVSFGKQDSFHHMGIVLPSHEHHSIMPRGPKTVLENAVSRWTCLLTWRTIGLGLSCIWVNLMQVVAAELNPLESTQSITVLPVSDVKTFACLNSRDETQMFATSAGAR